MGNRAWDMITVRNEMQDAMQKKYGNYQKDVLDPLSKSYSDYGKEAMGKIDTMMGDVQGRYSQFMPKFDALDSSVGSQYDALSGELTGLAGKFGGLGTSIGADYDKFNSGTVDPLKEQMYGMMTDEGKRGYSESTKNAMYSKQAEALTGAKSSYMKNMGKTLASQGLGSASGGMRNRMLNQYESENAKNLRSASRDVQLADAEAKRADLWSAVQGYGSAANLESQALGAKTQGQLGALQGESGAMGIKAGAMGDAAKTRLGILQGAGDMLNNQTDATGKLLNLGVNTGFDALAGQGNVAQMGQQNLRDELAYWAEKASQSQAYSGTKNQESGFWKTFKNALGGALGNTLGSFGMKTGAGGSSYSFGG